MPSFLTKLSLFMSSYLPLWVICGIQFYSAGRVIGAYIAGAVSILGLIMLFGHLRLARNLNPVQIKVSRINRRDGEAMSYIVTYLVPFIALPSGKPADVISLCVFLALLAVLYMNSDMIHINPVLNLLGWHIYEVEPEDRHPATVLSKTKIRKDAEISAVQIGDDLFLAVEKGVMK